MNRSAGQSHDMNSMAYAVCDRDVWYSPCLPILHLDIKLQQQVRQDQLDLIDGKEAAWAGVFPVPKAKTSF